MIKKIFSVAVCALLLASLLATSVGATGFADVNEGFETLPAGLEGVEGVSVQTNKSLNIHLDGKAGNTSTDNGDDTKVPIEWGYKGWIFLSSEMITTDSTVTFWVKRIGEVDGCAHTLPLVLSDSINKVSEGENLGGAAIGTDNRSRLISVYQNTDGVAGTIVQSTATIADATWVRMDYVVDFTARKTQVYADCVLIGESEFTANAMGFKGLKTCMFASGNYDMDFIVDEIVVRNGKIAPAADDVCGNQNRDAIEADSTVAIYEPFDSKNANTLSNVGKYAMTIIETDAFNQSTLSVVAPHGETAFEAYIPLSDTSLEGNATVSFKVKNEYTVKKLPGLKIKLADADKKVLGGIVIGTDAGFYYDDGTNVYNVKDANGAIVMTKTGQWYNVDLLVNYSNKSITLYIDGVRMGTVAMEAQDMTGFSGVLLSKQATTGAKNQTFAFDNLTVISGLYAPGAGSETAEDDASVTIDTQYTPVQGGDNVGEGENNADGGNNENNENNENNNGSGNTNTDAQNGGTADTTPNEKGGCASSVAIGAMGVTAVAAAAVVMLSKKKKD